MGDVPMTHLSGLVAGGGLGAPSHGPVGEGVLCAAAHRNHHAAQPQRPPRDPLAPLPAPGLLLLPPLAAAAAPLPLRRCLRCTPCLPQGSGGMSGG